MQKFMHRLESIIDFGIEWIFYLPIVLIDRYVKIAWLRGLLGVLSIPLVPFCMLLGIMIVGPCVVAYGIMEFSINGK